MQSREVYFRLSMEIQSIFCAGRKGIGKSSLLLLADLVADGHIPTLEGRTLNFIVSSIELVGSSTYEDIVTCIAT
jgi:hypothetical protein